MECFEVPRLSLDWSIQSKKVRVFVSFLGLLPKGHARRRPWEMGEIVYHKGDWGSHVRDFHLLVTLRAIV